MFVPRCGQYIDFRSSMGCIVGKGAGVRSSVVGRNRDLFLPLYLLHLPAKFVFGHFSGQLMGHVWFLVVVVFPIAVGLSLLVQTYVERPAQSWVKRWAMGARSVRRTAL